MQQGCREQRIATLYDQFSGGGGLALAANYGGRGHLTWSCGVGELLQDGRMEERELVHLTEGLQENVAAVNANLPEQACEHSPE
jgi:hypothetical protein